MIEPSKPHRDLVLMVYTALQTKSLKGTEDTVNKQPDDLMTHLDASGDHSIYSLEWWS